MKWNVLIGARYKHMETGDVVTAVQQYAEPPSVKLFFQGTTGDGLEVLCDLEFFLEYYQRLA